MRQRILFRSLIILAAILSLFAGSTFVTQSARGEQPKNVTAEQIAEAVILISGSRPVLNQIRRNGIERGRASRMGQDGRIEESRYELRFMRGDNADDNLS